jgi:hypothetical protein
MRLAAVHKRFIEGTKIGIIVAAHLSPFAGVKAFSRSIRYLVDDFKLVTVLSKAVAPKN